MTNDTEGPHSCLRCRFIRVTILVSVVEAYRPSVRSTRSDLTAPQIRVVWQPLHHPYCFCKVGRKNYVTTTIDTRRISRSRKAEVQVMVVGSKLMQAHASSELVASHSIVWVPASTDWGYRNRCFDGQKGTRTTENHMACGNKSRGDAEPRRMKTR